MGGKETPWQIYFHDWQGPAPPPCQTCPEERLAVGERDCGIRQPQGRGGNPRLMCENGGCLPEVI